MRRAASAFRGIAALVARCKSTMTRRMTENEEFASLRVLRSFSFSTTSPSFRIMTTELPSCQNDRVSDEMMARNRKRDEAPDFSRTLNEPFRDSHLSVKDGFPIVASEPYDDLRLADTLRVPFFLAYLSASFPVLGRVRRTRDALRGNKRALAARRSESWQRTFQQLSLCDLASMVEYPTVSADAAYSLATYERRTIAGSSSSAKTLEISISLARNWKPGDCRSRPTLSILKYFIAFMRDETRLLLHERRLSPSAS